MTRPIESDYTSQVAYTRALEAYCDSLPQLEQPAQQEPVGYEHHEYRPYSAPSAVRIHAVLASQYKMPDGTIADDFKWLIDGYKANPNTIKLLPLYTTPPQRKPLTDEEIIASNYPDGEENGPTIAAPDFELVAFARQIEAAHGIKKENT